MAALEIDSKACLVSFVWFDLLRGGGLPRSAESMATSETEIKVWIVSFDLF